MKTLLLLGAVALSLGLAGCGEEPEPEKQEADAAPSEGTAVVKPDQSDPDPVVDGITSAYTKYDLDDCKVLAAEAEEGESLWARCEGYNGVPLYVNVGDGRFDVDVGVPNDFRTITGFNELNDTIEWRLNGGKPFAVIARLKDVSMETGGNSALMVETVGTSAKPGCRVAHVWNSLGARQNVTARQVADRTLEPDFTCPTQPRDIE